MKGPTSPDQQLTAATAIQSELPFEQNEPPSKAKMNLKRARTRSKRSKYASEADETDISPSRSRCKSRLDMSSSPISRQPSPAIDNVNPAMGQASKTLESNYHAEDLDSLTPASTQVKTSTYSSFRPSQSHSSSYSPPPSKPKARKVPLVAVGKSKETFPSVLGKRSSVEERDYSPVLSSTMMYAP